MAEKLAFEEVGGEGGAVGGDERLSGVSQAVESLCDELLAGAGFADDDDGVTAA